MVILMLMKQFQPADPYIKLWTCLDSENRLLVWYNGSMFLQIPLCPVCDRILAAALDNNIIFGMHMKRRCPCWKWLPITFRNIAFSTFFVCSQLGI